jgi:hypothetical protein
VGGGYRFERLQQRDVAFEVVGIEARMIATSILRLELVQRLDRGGEEPAPEGGVSHKGDPELAAGREDVLFHVARPQRVLGLERNERMHFVRAPQGRHARLGKREIAHLALVDQLFHCAHGILDRHFGVDAMQPVDIDHFHAEALERGITSLRHVTGMTR